MYKFLLFCSFLSLILCNGILISWYTTNSCTETRILQREWYPLEVCITPAGGKYTMHKLGYIQFIQSCMTVPINITLDGCDASGSWYKKYETVASWDLPTEQTQPGLLGSSEEYTSNSTCTGAYELGKKFGYGFSFECDPMTIMPVDCEEAAGLTGYWYKTIKCVPELPPDDTSADIPDETTAHVTPDETDAETTARVTPDDTDITQDTSTGVADTESAATDTEAEDDETSVVVGESGRGVVASLVLGFLFWLIV